MKKSILYGVVWLLFIGSSGATWAQDLFGDRCVGRWSGIMFISRQGVVKDSVSVRLTVSPTSSPTAWGWKTEYLSDRQPMTKDYVLRLTDKAKNQYVTDEGDGLLLTETLYGQKLYSVFETHGVLLTSTYELTGNTLIFEVTSGKKETARHPEVNTFSVDNLQRVVFRRVN